VRSRTARLVYRLLLNRPHRRLKTRAVGAAWFLSANTVQQAAKREWWRAQRSTQLSRGSALLSGVCALDTASWTIAPGHAGEVEPEMRSTLPRPRGYLANRRLVRPSGPRRTMMKTPCRLSTGSAASHNRFSTGGA